MFHGQFPAWFGIFPCVDTGVIAQHLNYTCRGVLGFFNIQNGIENAFKVQLNS